MKNLLKNILVLAVMLGTYTSYANSELEVTPTFKYVKKGNLISVADATGEIIYSGEVYDSGNLTTLYDFSQLRNGKYTVELTTDFEIKINTLEVKNHKVSYLSVNQKTIHKPVVRIKDSRILISKLSLNTQETKVELYFEGELIHSETIKGEKVLTRVYQLEGINNGNLTTVVSSDGRVFMNDLRI